MKIKLLLLIFFFISISELKAQITYFDTYESLKGTGANYIQLIKSSITDGTGRYTYDQSAGALPTLGGSFYRIKFGNLAHANSWVLEYSSDGHNSWTTGFYNNSQTTPLPPSLSYGGWTMEPGNSDDDGGPDVLITLSGADGVDVTNGAAANPPTVITSTTLANITASTATVGGTVTADGGAVLTARGIVYGTSGNPTIGGPGVVDQGKTTGTFTANLLSLTASTTYHYRAYATNSAGTNYGGDQFFTTTASPATITGVTSSTANGTYITGDVISIQVNFSSAVAVTGIPRLQLSTGTTNRQVNYSGTGNGTSTLTFNYTVQDGDVSTDLDYLSTTALTLNGGTIINGVTNATLTLATPGAAGSLGANKNIVIDAQAPTATLVMAVGAMKVGETSLVTITFSEAVTGFNNADLTIANGTLRAVASGDGGVTWTTTFTPTAGITNAVNVITLKNNGVADAAGNAGTGSTNSNNYAIDTQRPTATIVVADAALKAGETSLVTITFSEAVTNFTNADLTIANGTLATVSSSDGGTTWTAIFTPTAGIINAVNVITLKNNGVADAAGNAGTGSTNSNNYTIDTQRPTATIVVAVGALKVGETSLVTITFNKAVSGFTNADLTIANGTLAAISTSDGGTTWTATFTPTAGITNAVNVITLDNTGVTDATGNAGTGSTNSNNYAIDTQRPTATIVVAVGAMKVGETSLVTITFSEAVTGFTNADLTIANGTLAAISTSDGGTIWTATFTPTAGIKNAVNVITLDNTGVADAAGNAGTGSTNSNNYAIDTQRPTATIVVAVAALKAGETSLVTITFSEAVTAFTNADLTIANGTLAAVSSSDGGTTWTAIFTPTAGITNAVNVITLDNTGVSDLAGNAGTGSTPSNNYAIDTKAPDATSAPLLSSLSDTGISGDNITSLTTPTFTGTAEPGATITLYDTDGSTVLGTTPADGSGNWSITSSTLTATSHTITAKATDAAGNVSTISSGLNITIDNTVPVAPLLSLPTNNAAILVATPEVKGTAEPGAVVTINIDGTVVNTGVTTDGSGNWTYTASALPNGPHAVKVLATDVSGNASAYSSTIEFTINIDPTITATGTLSALTATYGTASSSTSFTVSGINMNAGVLVTPPAGFEVSTDNTTFSNTVTAGAAGVISQIVYVRLKNTTAANTYSANHITLSSAGAANVTAAIPNSSVAPLAIAITADTKSKTYGDADPEFTYKVTTGALANADAFTGTLTRNTGENVNTYSITQGTLALNSNYALTYVPANLTIGTRALIIIADNKDKLAGAVNPALTVSYLGFITDESNTVFTVQPSVTTTAVTTSPIGTYDIDAGGAAAANYNISYQKGVLTIHPAAPTSITLTPINLYENSASGNNAGTLGSTSADPAATFTYTLVPGTGSTDNALFSISGNKINTNASLDFENKAVYKVRVRSTTQTDQWLEQELSISLADVNETPTLAAVSDQTICYTTAAQTVTLSGISAGPETAQTTALSVNSSNANLFESLTATGSGASGTLRYKVKNGAAGMATVTVTVTDNGGTTNGGVNTYSRTFVITVNALPVVTVSSNKGTKISKGETAILSAMGGTSYIWAVNSSILNGQNTAMLTVRPRETTTYTVTATNASGCTETQTYTLTVLDDLVTIKATNILTPNNDGYNDKWVVDNIDFYPNNEVKIFDKAGRLLYSKKGYDNSWDGTYNGIPLAESTYYYIIDFGTGRAKFKGFITIARQD